MTNHRKALKNESIKNISKNIVAQQLQNEKCCVCHDKHKRPINPITGRYTDITNPINRWDCQTALNGVSKFKNVVSVGIILGETPEGNLSGLDIDDCISEEGNISKEAQEIINLLGTYTERSTSGKGIHILFFAKKSGSRCKKSNLEWCSSFELYERNRYFILTGDCINNKPIEHRQAEFNRIYQNFFENKENLDVKYMSVPVTSSDYEKDAKKLRMGLKYNKKLRDYWNGERPTTDESSNDLGFMSCLMFWTNYNVNLSIETLKNSPYAQMKDAEHKIKMERKDYLLRTTLKCLQDKKDGGEDGKL